MRTAERLRKHTPIMDPLRRLETDDNRRRMQQNLAAALVITLLLATGMWLIGICRRAPVSPSAWKPATATACADQVGKLRSTNFAIGRRSRQPAAIVYGSQLWRNSERADVWEDARHARENDCEPAHHRRRGAGSRAWHGPDVADEAFLVRLTPEVMAELDQRCRRTEQGTRADHRPRAQAFPARCATQLMAGVKRQLDDGLGFVILDRLPVDRWSKSA